MRTINGNKVTCIMLSILMVLFGNCTNNNGLVIRSNDYVEITEQTEPTKRDIPKKRISKTYPFNTADSMEIVTYPDSIWSFIGHIKDEKHDTWLLRKANTPLPKLDDGILVGKVQIEELFDILFKNPIPPLETEVMGCYNPRHAFLFKKKGKIISYIEICLECEGNQVYRAEFGNPYDGKYCNLKKFLEKNGVKKGLEYKKCD